MKYVQDITISVFRPQVRASKKLHDSPKFKYLICIIRESVGAGLSEAKIFCRVFANWRSRVLSSLEKTCVLRLEPQRGSVMAICTQHI